MNIQQKVSTGHTYWLVSNQLKWKTLVANLLMFLLLLPGLASANSNDQWSDEFVSTVLAGGNVQASTTGKDGSVYIGGTFSVVGGKVANRIAKWDPVNEQWSALGKGLNNSVLALTTGSDGAIYAAGDFTSADGSPANRIAKWDPDTQQWSALGGGLNQSVVALTTGSDGAIYAGGFFTFVDGSPMRNIAKWDPLTEQWSALGDGSRRVVRALTTGSDGAIYAGGSFTSADGSTASQIAKWDPTTEQWSALGEGLNSSVSALTTGSDGAIYAGGGFTSAGGSNASRIAKWDPVTQRWSALGRGSRGAVGALTTGSDGAIYAGGQFNFADSAGNRIAKWDPVTEQWSALSGELNRSSVAALTTGSDGEIYAGGSRIAKWDPAAEQWATLGEGLNNKVQALTTGSDGAIYAGGLFSHADGSAANHIQKWDPVEEQWVALGDGLNNQVLALTTGSDGAIYAGGAFFSADGSAASRIAKWDPIAEQWSGLGGGLNDTVNALTTGSDGAIYAAGRFNRADGAAARHIAKWDPVAEQWSALGDGLNSPVRALTTGSDGAIYAGGDFFSADGSPANRIARWDPVAEEWSALGDGLNNRVFALTTDSDGAVYASGFFTSADGSPANRIAKWDPIAKQWSALGDGLSSLVGALTTGSDGAIYAGGHFISANGSVANRIAKWDPVAEQWSALGDGLNDIVWALTTGSDGTIYTGGEFTIAGGKVSPFMARWVPNTAPEISSLSTATVPENQTAAIDVQTDDDFGSEGSGLTYSKTGGADQALFSLDTGNGVLTFTTAPDFEAPADADGNNDYEVQVTVTDTGGLTDLQNIVITVTDVDENAAPVISSSATALAAENQTAAIDVIATDDNDSEGSGLTYSRTGGADQTLFNLDASSGVLTFPNAPDFESPADADGNNDYEVQVTVTDTGGLTDVQDIVITVTDVDENTAPVISSSATASVAENQTEAIDVKATDDSDSEGSGLTYNKSGGADRALFNLDGSNGVLTFADAPDFELPADADGNNDYEVQVTVTDSGGLTDAQEIVITVTDVDENTAPIISSGATASVAENQTLAIDIQTTDDNDTEGSGLTYSKTGGADQALFNLNPSFGVLTFANAPDFESPADADGNNDYDIQITVTDSSDLTDVLDLTITVTDDPDDNPILCNPQVLSRSVNPGSWHLLHLPCQPPTNHPDGTAYTLGDLFGTQIIDDSQWAAFYFDTMVSTPRYRQLLRGDPIPPQGFWFISLQPLTLTLPANSIAKLSADVSFCGDPNECAVQSISPDTAWNLLGNPLDGIVRYSNVLLTNIDTHCQEFIPCSLDSANNDPNISLEAFVYDTGLGKYLQLGSTEPLQQITLPWSGYWINLTGDNINQPWQLYLRRQDSQLMFVTDEKVRGDIAGIEEANNLCQQAAVTAGLPGSYKAWLSNSATSPASTHSMHDRPYLRLDGAVVAANWAELVSTGPLVPLNTTPNRSDISAPADASVWTNTNDDGSILSTLEHCNNWTAADSSSAGTGLSSAIGTEWTNTTSHACNTEHRLYCVGGQ